MNHSPKTILYIGNILSSHGFSVTTIETLGKQLEGCGYSIIYSSDKKRLGARMFDMVSTLVKNRKKVDTVLIDTYSYKAFWFCYVVSMISRWFNIPYMPILHGGKLPDRLVKKPRSSRHVFDNSLMNIAPSKYLQAAFQEHGFQANYVPNNIDISQYKFKERLFCEPKLLYVRSFDRIYNPVMAIKTLAEVKKVHPDATLCMVGPDKDGTQKECREKAKELGILDSVTFSGKLLKQEWHQLSEEYSIFINTTNIDNMPVSIIEALALGLPIVSTNAGGLPYLLEDGKDALLVEIGNVNQMSDCILQLISDDQKARLLSMNGRTKAESFDWCVVKKMWETALN